MMDYGDDDDDINVAVHAICDVEDDDGGVDDVLHDEIMMAFDDDDRLMLMMVLLLFMRFMIECDVEDDDVDTDDEIDRRLISRMVMMYQMVCVTCYVMMLGDDDKNNY